MKSTKYHLILIRFENNSFYEGQDRILKNSTYEEALHKSREIWRDNEGNNPVSIKIKNELDKTLMHYVK